MSFKFGRPLPDRDSSLAALLLMFFTSLLHLITISFSVISVSILATGKAVHRLPSSKTYSNSLPESVSVQLLRTNDVFKAPILPTNPLDKLTNLKRDGSSQKENVDGMNPEHVSLVQKLYTEDLRAGESLISHISTRIAGLEQTSKYYKEELSSVFYADEKAKLTNKAREVKERLAELTNILEEEQATLARKQQELSSLKLPKTSLKLPKGNIKGLTPSQESLVAKMYTQTLHTQASLISIITDRLNGLQSAIDITRRKYFNTWLQEGYKMSDFEKEVLADMDAKNDRMKKLRSELNGETGKFEGLQTEARGSGFASKFPDLQTATSLAPLKLSSFPIVFFEWRESIKLWRHRFMDGS